MYDEDKKIHKIKIHKEVLENDTNECIELLIAKMNSLNPKVYQNSVRIEFLGFENERKNLQDIDLICDFGTQLFCAYDGLFYWLDISIEFKFWWQLIQNSKFLEKIDMFYYHNRSNTDFFVPDVIQRVKAYCEDRSLSSYSSILLISLAREKLDNKLLKETIANREYYGEFNDKLNKLYSKILKENAENITNGIIKKVIREFQNMKGDAFTLSGDDSGLENIWDEICVQVQAEEFVTWNVYENQIELSIQSKVEELDFDEAFAVWLLTDKFDDWSSCDSHTYSEGQEYTVYDFFKTASNYFDEDGYPNDFCIDDVKKYLFHRIINEASDYTNKRIEKYLERSGE